MTDSDVLTAIVPLVPDADNDRLRLSSIYEAALANTPDLVYVIDLDHRFVYANKALLELWGRTAEDAIGKNLEELGYEQWHADMHNREIEEVIATRKAVRGEVPFNGTHGHRIYDYIFAPVFAENGDVTAISGTTRDITERREAEEKRLESEQQLRQMTDALPQQVWTATPDGQLDYINAYTRHYTGDIPVIDGIVQWTYVVHPEDLPRSLEAWSRALAAGELYETEQRILHKPTLCYRWNLSRALPMRDAQDKIIKWYGTNTDIEEQKKAAEAVIEAREHLSLMVESAQDYAIISTDADGVIISWNSGAERVFGYATDEVTGKSIGIIYTPEDLEQQVHRHELEVAAMQGRARDERWHLRKNGRRFYASGIMAAMKDQAGRIRGFIKIARDMTLEQTAQQELIAARNAAETANIAKTEFLANMSHEIRTPMNAVIGLSHILAVSEPLTSKQKEFIKTLQTSADSLLALINDLLDIAKIEAHSVELERVPFSVMRIVQETISMMTVRSHEKGLDFTIEKKCACVDKRLFIGDPNRLRQILLNLCSNAIKFTEKGGVHIEIACEATQTPGREMVHIAVKDTGIGIAADKLETVFQKFVQADTSINRKYGGTGLGLTITKTLAEIMDGTIEVASEPGIGSTFTVRLPLEIAPPQPEETSIAFSGVATASETISGQPHILLVEDYAPNVMVATTFLEQFGYGCEVATNGMEAIEKVKTGRFAVVLMDVQMHGMNGLEATILIRAYEKQKGKPRIPIIGMTAHALLGDQERCLSAGMDDYIAKPFNPDELQKKIRIRLYQDS